MRIAKEIPKGISEKYCNEAVEEISTEMPTKIHKQIFEWLRNEYAQGIS